MSQYELQRPDDQVQWVPAPEEECEIAAQFFAAPYPYQNGQLDREHHELSGIGAHGTTSYWPPLIGDEGGYIDGCCSYYVGDNDGAAGAIRNAAPQLKRKTRAGHRGGLGRQHKKKARASDKYQENVQSSSFSDDESNCSQVNCGMEDHVGGGGNGKTPARRGSATGAQSLYARKRRERINGRLKILQKLVPNGTKVDISTMLEEAVHYVKFLQLQIKMLSSDELWMYAPIAYNGMDLGIDLNISPPR